MQKQCLFLAPIGDGSINRSSTKFIIGATLSTATRVKHLDNMETAIPLFPNPAIDLITVTGLSKPAIADIYSINGVLVKSFHLDQINNNLDINDLTAGMYMIRLRSEDETIVKKLIKR